METVVLYNRVMSSRKFLVPGLIGLATFASVGALVYANLRILALTSDVKHLTQELASTTSTFSGRTDSLTTELAALDAKSAQELLATKSSVDDVRTQMGGVAQTVGTISGTVNTLEKLTKTDPELLQKYSKVFFLNENYKPERVSEIDKMYLYSESHAEVIHAQVLPYLTMMLNVAYAQNVKLYVKSAYRSFDEQKSLKSAYSVTYGAGTANSFSADQGYSEHQLGTAIDFIASGLGGNLDGFDKTTAYKWMQDNAYRYGFVLSYPLNNKYYVYEPWHWRYVGVKLATYLHDNNKHFYDLDQREIDNYLVDLF